MQWYLSKAVTKSLEHRSAENVQGSLTGDRGASDLHGDYAKSLKADGEKGFRWTVKPTRDLRGTGVSGGRAGTVKACAPAAWLPPDPPRGLVPGELGSQGALARPQSQRDESGLPRSPRTEGFRFIYSDNCRMSVP